VSGAKIESMTVSTYTVPTDAPESDGTLERVMNSIRNGLEMRETEIAREPS
jgi:hypothetical protein